MTQAYIEAFMKAARKAGFRNAARRYSDEIRMLRRISGRYSLELLCSGYAPVMRVYPCPIYDEGLIEFPDNLALDIEGAAERLLAKVRQLEII